MKPVTFPEANVVYGEGQPQYQPLPAFYAGKDKNNNFIDKYGHVVFCFEFENDEEREAFLKTGKLYIVQLTFNRGFHPINCSPVNFVKPTKQLTAEQQKINSDVVHRFSRMFSNAFSQEKKYEPAYNNIIMVVDRYFLDLATNDYPEATTYEDVLTQLLHSLDGLDTHFRDQMIVAVLFHITQIPMTDKFKKEAEEPIHYILQNLKDRDEKSNTFAEGHQQSDTASEQPA